MTFTAARLLDRFGSADFGEFIVGFLVGTTCGAATAWGRAAIESHSTAGP
jgi:hypothetical protein